MLACLRSLNRKIILAIFLLLLGSVSCSRDRLVDVAPGKLAPDFELLDLDANKIKLSDYRGKVVLLNFWATWCLPCVSEMPALERLHQQYKDSELVVLSVAIDEQLDNLKSFRRRYSITFPILFDSESRIKEAYSLTGVPESFLIDKEGKFLLFDDPEYNMTTVRILGPHKWDSASMAGRITYLMRK